MIKIAECQNMAPSTCLLNNNNPFRDVRCSVSDKTKATKKYMAFSNQILLKPFEIEDFAVDNIVVKILSIRKTIRTDKPYYPYETQEYKIYTTKNGRKYEIYKNGRVISLPFSYTDTKGRIRCFPRREAKPSITEGGYWELNIGGRCGERWLLHRLIAFVWIPNLSQCDTVDHRNNNKNDNSVENLEWLSRVENIRKEHRDGLSRRGNIRADYLNWKSSCKVNPIEKQEIKHLYQKGLNQRLIAKRFGVSQAQISVILKNGKNTSDNFEIFEECWLWERVLAILNVLRDKYIETSNNDYLKLIDLLLPQSYMNISKEEEQ